MNAYQNEYDRILSKIALHICDAECVYRQTNNYALKIVTLLPYIAGCSNPERKALVNANTFFLLLDESSKASFLHGQQDDDSIFTRLTIFDVFQDGDKNVIRKGMLLLSLIMIQDYYQDRQIDMRENKYNPLNSKRWDYYSVHNNIINEIKQIDAKIIDDIFPLESICNQFFWES